MNVVILLISASTGDEPLEAFLQRRRDKKKTGQSLGDHIANFFQSKGDMYGRTQIDVQVTVKGDLDVLRPLACSTPSDIKQEIKLEMDDVKSEDGVAAVKKEIKIEDEEVQSVGSGKSSMEIQSVDSGKASMEASCNDKEIIIVQSEKEIIEINLSDDYVSSEEKSTADSTNNTENLRDNKVEGNTSSSNLKGAKSGTSSLSMIYQYHSTSMSSEEDLKNLKSEIDKNMSSEVDETKLKAQLREHLVEEESDNFKEDFEIKQEQLKDEFEDNLDVLMKAEVKDEVKLKQEMDIKEEKDIKKELLKEEVSYSSSTTHGSTLLKPATFVAPEVAALETNMKDELKISETFKHSTQTFLERNLMNYSQLIDYSQRPKEMVIPGHGTEAGPSEMILLNNDKNAFSDLPANNNLPLPKPKKDIEETGIGMDDNISKLPPTKDTTIPACLPNAGLNTGVIHSGEIAEAHEDTPKSDEATVQQLKGALNKDDLKEVNSYDLANSTDAQSNEIINISPNVNKEVKEGEEKEDGLQENLVGSQVISHAKTSHTINEEVQVVQSQNLDADRTDSIHNNEKKQSENLEAKNGGNDSESSLLSVGTNVAYNAALHLQEISSGSGGEEILADSSRKFTDNEADISSTVDSSMNSSSNKVSDSFTTTSDISSSDKLNESPLDPNTFSIARSQIKVHEASVETYTPIPPEGSVMVDFRQPPITVTANLTEKDSVTEKIAELSKVAEDYSTKNRLAADIMKAQQINIDLTKSATGVDMESVRLIVDTKDVSKDSTSKKTIPCESRHSADVLDSDEILDGDAGSDVEMLDDEQEKQLLDSCNSPSHKPLLKTYPMRKRKANDLNPKDGNPAKKPKKTLGVVRKKTNGSANFSKKNRLPAFKTLAKEVLKTKSNTTDESTDNTSGSDSSTESSTSYDELNQEASLTKKMPNLSDDKEFSDVDEYDNSTPANVQEKHSEPNETKRDNEVKEDAALHSKDDCTEYNPFTNKPYIALKNDDFFSGMFHCHNLNSSVTFP